MYAREISSERLYTLSEAREILDRQEKENLRKLLIWIGYKLLALLCIIICIVTPRIMDGDATVWFIFIPATIYYLTRKVK